jgi:hypothetical protein
MVGTLSWLYHLLLTGRRESSSLQLLHYPVPKHGIPEMRRMVGMRDQDKHLNILRHMLGYYDYQLLWYG